MEEIDPGLLKQFRKSYRVIGKLQKEWQKTQNDSFVIMESLLNLSEQLQCCEEGAFEVELRNDFPDLKQRLTYKILKAMEGKMKKLYELLYTFKNLKDKLESARNSTFRVYRECTGCEKPDNYLDALPIAWYPGPIKEYGPEQLDIETVTKGSPTFPPVAVLLEWIMDLNRWYSSLYEQKKDLLDNICYNDKTYFQSLLTKWKDETCLFRVKGIMEQVSVFLSSFPT